MCLRASIPLCATVRLRQERPVVLLNGRLLLKHVGNSEAPVAVQCPHCKEVFVRKAWWSTLQQYGLDIVCVCTHNFTVPTYNPEDHQRSQQESSRTVEKSLSMVVSSEVVKKVSSAVIAAAFIAA
jgi:hypothetical protein